MANKCTFEKKFIVYNNELVYIEFDDEKSVKRFGSLKKISYIPHRKNNIKKNKPPIYFWVACYIILFY